MKRISLFPLPSTVFYPTTLLPLHIFEPRYRSMVANAIDSGQWIGMVLLKAGWEDEYYGTPEIVPVGCAGNVESWKQHPDGKYDIVLRGQQRFRVLREVGDTLYRQAEVEILPNRHDRTREEESSAFRELEERFQRFTDLLPEKNAQKVELDLSDCRTLGETLDRMFHFFNLPLDQKQAFLEEPDVRERFKTVMALLDFKIRIVERSLRIKQSGADVRWN